MPHTPHIQALMADLVKDDPRMIGFEPERLAAIAQEAENVKSQALSGLQVLGRLCANLGADGIEGDDLECVGYLTAFLADTVEACDFYEASARHAREHPNETRVGKGK